jgi:hypothetical protein
MSRIVCRAPLVALTLLAFGCGAPAPAGPGSGARAPTVEGTPSQLAPAVESTPTVESAPAVEGAGPEQPAPAGQALPAIKIKSLPVGKGSNVDAGRTTCVDVGWLGSPIPHGVSVVVTGVRFDPSDLFSQSRSGCDGPLCRDSFAFTADDGTCAVPVVAHGSPGDPGTLYLDGSLRCAEGRRACQDFAAKREQGSFDLLTMNPEPSDPSPFPSAS